MPRRAAEAGPSPSTSDDFQTVLLPAVRRARARLEPGAGFAAIEALVTPRLRRYFHRLSFAPEDAEDLVQEVLARAWLGLPRLQQEERFLQWLFAIAGNVGRTARARRLREERFVVGGASLVEEVADPRSASQHGTACRLRDAVRDAVNALPAQQRRCLVLRVRDELSYEQIADVLRLSPCTVRNHLAAAKRKLRRRLGQRPVGRP